MRPRGSAEQLERRRLLATRMLDQGLDPPGVADLLGVDVRSVQRWGAAAARDGEAALAAVPQAGARPKLSGGQAAQVLAWLGHTPTAFGFATERWTAPRVALLIRHLFGVRMNHRYLNDWLRRRGDITPQLPQRRPRERDEQAIRHWKRYRWPRVKKTPGSSGRRSRSATRAGSC